LNPYTLSLTICAVAVGYSDPSELNKQVAPTVLEASDFSCTTVPWSLRKLERLSIMNKTLHQLHQEAKQLRSYSESHWVPTKNEWVFWLRPYAKGKAVEQILVFRLQQILSDVNP